MEKVTKNQFQLFKRIIELSVSKDWESAKKEWTAGEITQVEEGYDYGTCTCGKYPIKEMIQLFNEKNRNEVIVGNCCVNHFFGIKDYNKVFKAIKENRVNKFMITESYEKAVINQWESNFMLKIWRKKKLTEKQNNVFKNIKDKILKYYKTSKN